MSPLLLPTPVPAIHHVVNRPGILHSEFSRHAPSLTPTRHLCQCLGLTPFRVASAPPRTEEGGHLAENRWSSFHGAGEECRNACPISRRAFVASPSEIRHRGDVWV